MSTLQPYLKPGSSVDWIGKPAEAVTRLGNRRRWIQVLVGLLACIIVGYVSYRVVFSANVERVAIANAQRLDFYVASLKSLLAKHEPLPPLVGFERDIVAALEAPANPARVRAANRYLSLVQAQAQVAAVYILTPDGLTIASSNWNAAQSFVGHNYAFRPYFRQAAAGGVGRFYGVGATTGEPGYFIATAVRSASGDTLGVAAVKLSLEEYESALRRTGETVLVVDDAGVVFLSTIDSWRYRVLAPLSEDMRRRLANDRQYGSSPLLPVDSDVKLDSSDAPQRVALSIPRSDEDGESAARERRYLAQSRAVGQLGWRIVLLGDLAEARQSAIGVGSAAGFACALLFAAAQISYLRRRRLGERREAKEALQRAHDELEARIAERTAELVDANAALQQKVSVLKETETILRETQDSAVQAGKLAVLGQMAAGVTHELNQPLAALATLSDNSLRFLGMSRFDDVRENLQTMGQVVERMGRIVGQLKAFARKGPVQLHPVFVRDALSNALLLIESRRREYDVRIDVVQADDAVQVVADPIRLEQVLVNLIRNAIDAMTDANDKRITIEVQACEKQVHIYIRDNGPGIASDALPHLFEPFFTTKPAGQGLGLGLAISLAIMRSLGGELIAENVPEGGAQFKVILVSV